MIVKELIRTEPGTACFCPGAAMITGRADAPCISAFCEPVRFPPDDGPQEGRRIREIASKSAISASSLYNESEVAASRGGKGELVDVQRGIHEALEELADG